MELFGPVIRWFFSLDVCSILGFNLSYGDLLVFSLCVGIFALFFKGGAKS